MNHFRVGLVLAHLVVFLVVSITSSSIVHAAVSSTHSTKQEPTIESAEANHMIEGYQWQGQKKLSPQAKLILENPYGNVSLRTTQGDKASLIGHIQRNKKSLTRVAIEIEETSDLVTIKVVYPPAHFAQSGNQKDRVDLGFVVPQDRRVEVRTKDGDVRGKNIFTFLKVESVGGNVAIKTSSAIEAKTQSGSINVAFNDVKTALASRFETESGHVQLSFLPGVDLKLDARSEQGQIDFTNEQGITKSYQRQFNLEVGAKEQEISAFTKTGRVKIGVRQTATIVTSSAGAKVSKRLTDLPPPKRWQPGDPIKVIPIGRIEKKASSVKKKSDPSEK